jgi:small conductance mechanosensitive channel
MVNLEFLFLSSITETMEPPIKKIEETIMGFNYHEVQQWVLKVGTELLMSLLILVIGFWLSNLASKTIKNILKKSNTDESLITFLGSLTSTALKLLVVVTSITQFGIQMTSFVALLGAAGLAIGMAFSGTLSNFAGGVMILVFKPFKVGDFIQAQTVSGKVKEIQIFNTHLYTADNKVVILPNGPIANGNIINFTKADVRRIDLTFHLTMGDSFEKAKEMLLEIASQDERIVKEPVPFVGLGVIATKSIEMHFKVWVKTDDYNTVMYDLNEKIYIQFSQAGLRFLVD